MEGKSEGRRKRTIVKGWKVMDCFMDVRRGECACGWVSG